MGPVSDPDGYRIYLAVDNPCHAGPGTGACEKQPRRCQWIFHDGIVHGALGNCCGSWLYRRSARIARHIFYKCHYGPSGDTLYPHASEKVAFGHAGQHNDNWILAFPLYLLYCIQYRASSNQYPVPNPDPPKAENKLPQRHPDTKRNA